MPTKKKAAKKKAAKKPTKKAAPVAQPTPAPAVSEDTHDYDANEASEMPNDPDFNE